ncbi:hypothetical protein JCM13580A_62830 [Streptomyces drozdowiczii]
MAPRVILAAIRSAGRGRQADGRYVGRYVRTEGERRHAEDLSEDMLVDYLNDLGNTFIGIQPDEGNPAWSLGRGPGRRRLRDRSPRT